MVWNPAYILSILNHIPYCIENIIEPSMVIQLYVLSHSHPDFAPFILHVLLYIYFCRIYSNELSPFPSLKVVLRPTRLATSAHQNTLLGPGFKNLAVLQAASLAHTTLKLSSVLFPDEHNFPSFKSSLPLTC